MKIFLYVVGALAMGSAGLAFVELMQTTRPNATVFQQISARVDIGLSLLAMICAFGFAGVMTQIERWMPAAAGRSRKPISNHLGIDIYKEGDTLVADGPHGTVRGSNLGDIRRQLDADKAAAA